MDSAERLGHFCLLEKIGEGGMGRVYKARDMQLERLVAIKVLPEARQSDADRRIRFVQEAKAASALNHPNIITIHEIGEQDEQTFIVMELVDGKPLNELIPRKGMRLAEALRIAAQVADALTAAHAAGIVHRDLKPANIMVDTHGRVKVLDFGLAKLTASASALSAADDVTHSLSAAQPVTEEGIIVGSFPYMSPEQAQGKPVDARSDIFSFGAVLYEMITGQRAFRGESRISTLAAIVEKDPPPPGEIAATPPELERLIVRCLRKDINRRSQNMSDVKLALEELRDESESGKLPGPAVGTPARGRFRRRSTIAICFVAIAAAAIVWIYLNGRRTQPRGTHLVRLSPDDGYNYRQPAISPDGGFVASVSNRSGDDELWLQQVGGGDPIQLTHSRGSISSPSFFPDGKRILYVATSAGNRSTIESIPALGGDARVIVQARKIVNSTLLSPDGRQVAYIERSEGGDRLMIASANGGQPRELTNWRRLQRATLSSSAVWTPDCHYVLSTISRTSATTNAEEVDWFAFPIDGGSPVNTGAGDALRAAGLEDAFPEAMSNDRVLFFDAAAGRANVWEIHLSPGSLRVQGVPQQLTSGTVNEFATSISSTGVVAVDIGSDFTDLYLIPLSATTGQPTGAARKLTRDMRSKRLAGLGGDSGNAYFFVDSGTRLDYYAFNLDSGKQTLLGDIAYSTGIAISGDSRQVAFSIPESDSYSIRVGALGTSEADARVLCKACGMAQRFSPDGRFLLYYPERRVKPDPNQKLNVRLLDLATGKDRPWVEHPTDSASVGNAVGRDSQWFLVFLRPPGSSGSERRYLVPWKEEPVPPSVWAKGGVRVPSGWRGAPGVNFFFGFKGSKLQLARIDPQRADFDEPQEVQFVPGSPVTLMPDDLWQIRQPGLVFTRKQPVDSVWLMELPR
jgi:serine/threonine protein kinase